MMREQHERHYTRDDLDHALVLKGKGLKWGEVAECLGRNVNSLQVMVTKYKYGNLKFQCERGDEFARLAEAGVPPKDIAARFDVSVTSVWSLLRYRGIDREMLRLYRTAA